MPLRAQLCLAAKWHHCAAASHSSDVWRKRPLLERKKHLAALQHEESRPHRKTGNIWGRVPLADSNLCKDITESTCYNLKLVIYNVVPKLKLKPLNFMCETAFILIILQCSCDSETLISLRNIPKTNYWNINKIETKMKLQNITFTKKWVVVIPNWSPWYKQNSHTEKVFHFWTWSIWIIKKASQREKRKDSGE